MGEHHNQTENIIQAISLTQKLRTSVGKVFDNLGDGFAVSQGNEKALLNTFQQSLLAVNNDFRYMYCYISISKSKHSSSASEEMILTERNTFKYQLGRWLICNQVWEISKTHGRELVI